MVFGLSASHEIGLAVCGAIFVAFALLSSFYFPSRNPDFPGKAGLRWYVPLSAILFLGMMGAVLYFGQEKKETAEAATTTETTTSTGSTTTGSTTTAAATGDPAAGKVVFNANGCAACHTYGPAASTGKVGPPLDDLTAEAEKADHGSLEEFTKESIEDPGAYIAPGFQNAMPPFGDKLSDKQLDDLVAFLTQPQ